jgi:hypothetical protein
MNNKEWKSDSAKGNTIKIISDESDPSLKITKAEITFQRQKRPINLRKLLSFKHKQNHEGKS